MDKRDELMKAINKKYKKDIVVKGTEMRKFEFIPFSSPKMNYVTRGGVVKGKMIEFVGAEGSGKTTSALDNLANFQKIDDRLALYLDAENTLDVEWGEKLGVDWERVILIKPESESAEMLLNMLIDIVDSGEIGWACVDSIPFLVPKAVLEGTLEDKTYAGNSGVMTTFCHKVIPKIAKKDVTLIMINQLRDKIGSTYVAYNTPGGRALKHSYSQRIFFYKGRFIDKDGKEVTNAVEYPAGNVIDVKIEKNKVSKPDRRIGSYTLRYETGVDVMNDTIDVAILLDLITQGGAWYYLIDKDTGEIIEKFQGKVKLIEYLETNEPIFSWLYSRVNSKILD